MENRKKTKMKNFATIETTTVKNEKIAKIKQSEHKWRHMKKIDKTRGKLKKNKENEKAKTSIRKKKNEKVKKKCKNEEKWKLKKNEEDFAKCEISKDFFRFLSLHAKSWTISRICRCCCCTISMIFSGVCFFPEESQQPILGVSVFPKWQFYWTWNKEHTF